MMSDDDTKEFNPFQLLKLIEYIYSTLTDSIDDGYITDEEAAENLKEFIYSLEIPTVDKLAEYDVSNAVEFIDSISYAVKRISSDIKSYDNREEIQSTINKKAINSIVSTCTDMLRSSNQIDIKEYIDSINGFIVGYHDNKIEDVVVNTIKEYYKRSTQTRIATTDYIVNFLSEIEDEYSIMADIPDDIEDLFREYVLEDHHNEESFYENYINGDEDNITFYKLSSNVNVKSQRGFNTYIRHRLF